MGTKHARPLALGCMIAVAATVPAATRAADQPSNALHPLLACRDVADDAGRLACFDRESAALDAAAGKKEIAVLDREDMRKTRRSIFGLGFLSLPFLAGRDEAGDDEGQDQLTATIASARSIGQDKWLFVLEDGARWQTTEAVLYRPPAPGMTVQLRKATLGGYFASFAGSRQVRARRIE